MTVDWILNTLCLAQERSALAVQADKAEAIRQAEAEEPGMAAQETGVHGEVDVREKLAKQRNKIRHAAQKGMSLKAAYIELNGMSTNRNIEWTTGNGQLECRLIIAYHRD